MRHRMTGAKVLALLLVGGAALAASPYEAPPGVFPATGPRDFTGAYAGASRLGAAPAASSATSVANGAGAGCAPSFVTGIGAGPTHVVSGKDVMAIAYEENHVVRRIHLNGRHPKDLKPSIMGHSIGSWDGDTLVVETVGLLSGRTVVERIRKVAGGRQIETVVDGRAMLANWRPDLTWAEAICEVADVRAAPVSQVEAAGPAAQAAKASFDGVWQITRPVNTLRTSDGRAPPLLPAAHKLHDERIALMKAGRSHEYDASARCQPKGDPRTGYEGQPFDIVQNSDAIFIGHTWNRMVRFAYARGRHPVGQVPSYYGSWISRWDGDSLVLEGTGFNDSTLLDAAGLPHSSELRVVQRLTLKDAGRQMDIHTTFDDAGTFTHPWTAVHHYRRLAGATIAQDICSVQLRP